MTQTARSSWVDAPPQSSAPEAALLLWQSVGSRPMTCVTVLKEKEKSQIYRLDSDVGAPSVVAKRGLSSSYAFERTFYEEVAPLVPGAAPNYHGSVVTGDGWTWLFMDYAGEEPCPFDTDEASVVVGAWLGALHARSATLRLGANLPDAGPGRYLDHLRHARRMIVLTLKDPAVRDDDRAALIETVNALDSLEAGFGSVSDLCSIGPRVLVHADLAPKNLRMAAAAGVVALDWEMVGYGSPAIDLGWLLSGSCGLAAVRAYREAVAGAWAAAEAEFWSVATVGQALRMLAAIDWETSRLPFESSCARAVRRIAAYRGSLISAVATALPDRWSP